MTLPGVEGNEPSTSWMPSIPAAPSIAEDPLLDTLPGAVISQQESPTVMRIGVVASILDGTRITVRVSGSDSLVNCSYLMGQYLPLLGDRVILLKQDSQWICIGTATGPIESNNALFNPSFEQPAGSGLTPTGWTLNVISSAAGVPFFSTAGPGVVPISGSQVATFGTNSFVGGLSSAEIFSTPVPAAPGSRWTAAYWVTRVDQTTRPPRFSFLELYIEFLNAASVVVTSTSVNTLITTAGQNGYLYRRLNLVNFPAGYVTAPPATVTARVRFVADFSLDNPSYVFYDFDNVILRQVN